MMAVERMLPVVDPDSAPFWTSCAEGRLTMQRCAYCGSFRWPPNSYCPHCHERGGEWTALEGSASVVAYTVVHQAFDPGFASTVPYVVAWLTLDGTEPELRMIGNIVDQDPELVRVGLRVEAGFMPVEEGLAIPVFRPAVHTRADGIGA